MSEGFPDLPCNFPRRRTKTCLRCKAPEPTASGTGGNTGQNHRQGGSYPPPSRGVGGTARCAPYSLVQR